LLNGPGLRYLFATLLLKHPRQSQQAASRMQLVMSTFCEATRGAVSTALSNIPPRYVGSEQKGMLSLLLLIFSSRLASLLLRWKTANTAFVALSCNSHVWWYLPTVAMSLLCNPSTVCSVSISMHDC